MLQRMQTVWLLLSSVFAFLTLKLSFFSGNILVNNAKEFQRFTAMSSIPLMIVTVAVSIASLITIFLFKDRKMQLRIALAALVLSVLNIIMYYLQTTHFILNEWSFDISSLVTIAIPFLLFFAIRGIYKDEKLVKRADRLR